MKTTNIFQVLAMAALMGCASVALAGKQGISFYGGLGLGAAAPQKDAPEYDTTVTGNIFLGMEEDGWHIEYNGLGSTETGTSVATTEYKLSGNIVSLGYRTLESRGGIYFLLNFGRATIDVDYSDATTTANTEGNVYTLGMGMRMDRTERLELNYSLYASGGVEAIDPDLGDVHMVTLRYIWGGTPYEHQW